jgi:bacterioferritin
MERPAWNRWPLSSGGNVKAMIHADLKLEIEAVTMYNESVRIAMEEKDNGSRDLFVALLKDEEDHVDWLEAQAHQIAELGYEHYLTMQTSEGE